MDAFEYNADKIESRLDVIKNLKNKYGNSYEDIMNFLSSAKDEKELYENYAQNTQDLLKEKSTIEKELYALYIKLSQARKVCAKEFSSNILLELKELGMPNSSFEIEFSPVEPIEECKFNSSNGFDQITFAFSANKGEPLKSMSQVISGGEMSRFMLAIKAQSAKFGGADTFVFDEIDAGISGNVAKVVAKKFAKISKDKQLIAISHLPQISAMADNNLLIVKSETADKTVTTVKTLNSQDKIKEIVRLVGGEIESENAVSHANELINLANEYKNELKSV
jgi:DNA repair protein RecN (Recombination protein N)